MAEFIVNILVEVVTGIWTLQCLARWRRNKRRRGRWCPIKDPIDSMRTK
ncbi:hypothetical protein [Bradyrhizobium acaciae]|nr:hypothetical protein [Bradyrhizobium acaciae]MCC8979932.1 hypothetical protein [Bradyrhizobium acaciae]